MLRETTLSMLQICELCGYSDQSYFTKTFKDMAGCSPSQYRKKQRNI
ncbi:helix-turn-helix domain-containing protein [uncultured Ruminococcus sp.]|nr:helix-turn-helix domain-containing protein [uncultured Ruminococcus sp.]